MDTAYFSGLAYRVQLHNSYRKVHYLLYPFQEQVLQYLVTLRAKNFPLKSVQDDDDDNIGRKVEEEEHRRQQCKRQTLNYLLSHHLI